MKRKLTEEQKVASEARHAKFRALVKSVAAMTDEQRQEIINRIGAIVTCEGRALSPFNTCLVISQCETASMVGGFQQWIKVGRAVRKGEKGLCIWIPRKPKADTDGSATPESGEATDEIRFILGTVFDVSQTDVIETELEKAA